MQTRGPAPLRRSDPRAAQVREGRSQTFSRGGGLRKGSSALYSSDFHEFEIVSDHTCHSRGAQGPGFRVGLREHRLQPGPGSSGPSGQAQGSLHLHVPPGAVPEAGEGTALSSQAWPPRCCRGLLGGAGPGGGLAPRTGKGSGSRARTPRAPGRAGGTLRPHVRPPQPLLQPGPPPPGERRPCLGSSGSAGPPPKGQHVAGNANRAGGQMRRFALFLPFSLKVGFSGTERQTC